MNKCKKRPAMLAPLSGTKKAFRTHARTHARTHGRTDIFFYFVQKQSHSASGNQTPIEKNEFILKWFGFKSK